MATEHISNKSRVPTASWRTLLRTALVTPGLIHEAYRRFHQYSLHNQLLAWSQCVDRGITPDPLHTFAGWLSLGRSVRRGEKAIILCVPIVRAPVDVENNEDAAPRPRFTYRARWFALSQTDGDEYAPVGTPDWHEGRALQTLGVELVPFEGLDGNAQGYALPGRKVAISPVAGLPHKTLFHELGHVVLGHPTDDKTPRAVKEAEAEAVALLCLEALDLPGTEYARGYLQSWLRGEEFSEESSQRVITAAQEILSAGAGGAG